MIYHDLSPYLSVCYDISTYVYYEFAQVYLKLHNLNVVNSHTHVMKWVIWNMFEYFSIGLLEYIITCYKSKILTVGSSNGW